MIEFFNRLFGRTSSSSTAKERLRLVLLSDHLALAPDVVAALKADLLEVISRYVDIDREQSDISFEQHDRSVAMMASVPVLGMKPQGPKPSRMPDEPLRHAPVHAEPVDAVASAGVQSAPSSSVAVAEPPAAEPEPGNDAIVTPAVEPIATAQTPDATDAPAAMPVQQLALGHPVAAAGRRKRKRTAAKANATAGKTSAKASPATARPATG